MDQLGTAGSTLRTLGSFHDRLLRRRSTGDIVLSSFSTTKIYAQLLRPRSSSFHYDFPQARRDRSVGDDPPSGLESPDTTEQEEMLYSSSDLASLSDIRYDEWRKEVAGVLTWRPWWLQPIILGTFACLFLCAAVALSVMLVYSQRKKGLCETRADLEYIWRFAPTAVLTIAAALWAQISLQATRYMVWIDLRRRKSTDDVDFMLDYTSMILPTVVFRSLRQKHYLVFAVGIVSALLKVQLLLASGLLSLKVVPVRLHNDIHTVNVFNVSAFEGDTQDILQVPDSSSYYIPRVIHDFNTSYPFSVAKEAAYQTFEPRGTTDTPTPIIVTVDGFFNDIRCLNLEAYSVISVRPPVSAKDYNYIFNLNLLYW